MTEDRQKVVTGLWNRGVEKISMKKGVCKKY
jgi:hypothetical protein